MFVAIYKQQSSFEMDEHFDWYRYIKQIFHC